MSTQNPVSLADGSAVLGRYRIVRRLGEGAFGTSFLAEEPALGHRVVLKVASATDSDGTLGRRLVAEGRILSRIDSPRVARLLEVAALEDGRACLVLEWIDGTTLQEVLAGGPLSVPDALAIIDSLARALEAVHAAGVIHRDLKPTNVVLPGGPGRPRFDSATLIDFGAFGELVRKARSQDVTQAGEFYGTLYYMAPEQIAATPQSPATDIYGLGVLLYEMLFGRPPHFGEQLVSLMGKRLGAEIPLPEGGPSGEVRSFLGCLLRRDPATRPRSATEVSSLVRALRARESQTERTGEITAAVAVPAAAKAVEAASPPEATAISRFSRRGRAGLMVFIGAGAIAFFFVIVFLLARRTPRTAAGASGGSGADLASVGGIAFGLLLIGGGVALGMALRSVLGRRGGEFQEKAGQLLLGTKSRDALTETLAFQVDELIARCRRVDERILGITIAQMVGEYRLAADSNQRQAALMNAAQLLEKLIARLSPWYVRHEKALAFAVSLVGVLTGVVSLVASVAKLLGKP